MKKFLIEFFRPVDTLIFNYLVRLGLIKPFLDFVVGALLGSRVAKRAFKKKSASKSQQAALIEKVARNVGTLKKKPVDRSATLTKAVTKAAADKKKANLERIGNAKPLLRAITANMASGKVNTSALRRPAGLGSVVTPGAAGGMNFARRANKKKLRAALGYGARLS